MVAMQTYDRSREALRGAVTRLNAQSGYDAVLIADNGRIAMGAAPMVREGTSADARLLGTDLWKNEEGLGATPALRGAWFASMPDNMFNQFRTRYRARYSSNPYRLARTGYSAVLHTLRYTQD